MATAEMKRTIRQMDFSTGSWSSVGQVCARLSQSSSVTMVSWPDFLDLELAAPTSTVALAHWRNVTFTRSSWHSGSDSSKNVVNAIKYTAYSPKDMA